MDLRFFLLMIRFFSVERDFRILFNCLLIVKFILGSFFIFLYFLNVFELFLFFFWICCIYCKMWLLVLKCFMWFSNWLVCEFFVFKDFNFWIFCFSFFWYLFFNLLSFFVDFFLYLFRILFIWFWIFWILFFKFGKVLFILEIEDCVDINVFFVICNWFEDFEEVFWNLYDFVFIFLFIVFICWYFLCFVFVYRG